MLFGHELWVNGFRFGLPSSRTNPVWESEARKKPRVLTGSSPQSVAKGSAMDLQIWLMGSLILTQLGRR